MKQILYIFILTVFLHSCQKTRLGCEFSGQRVVKQVDLQQIDTVIVNPLIQLTIYDDIENKMLIDVDKDVWKAIEYTIQGRTLNLTNHTNCLIQNKDAETFVTLHLNNLKTIIANTDMDIVSGNTLTFNDLSLICENNQVGTNNIADFDLTIQNQSLSIVANGTSIFNISGNTNNLFVGFYGVSPTFKGCYLQADKIRIFHRSSNDMHLYPVQEITGDLYGYGNIYLYNRPPVVNITQHYAGDIYFVN